MQPYMWLLIPIGFFTGFYGTLVGLGGGFILVPTLLFLYPDRGPELITSISLAVVFVNGLSGSLAYARMKRIDYRSGILFALAAMPGATIGALSTKFVPRTLFELVFGLVMTAASLFLFLNPPVRRNKRVEGQQSETVEDDTSPPTYNLALGIGVSIFVGFLTGFFGFGGGLVHMPMMLYVLHFPVHAATATSHFILTISTFTATVVHTTTGALSEGITETVLLAIGVVFGAQVGARVSSRIHGVWIVRGLAIALGIVGLRLVIGVLL